MLIKDLVDCLGHFLFNNLFRGILICLVHGIIQRRPGLGLIIIIGVQQGLAQGIGDFFLPDFIRYQFVLIIRLPRRPQVSQMLSKDIVERLSHFLFNNLFRGIIKRGFLI